METKYNILTRIIKNLRRSVLPVGKPSDAGKVATVGDSGVWGAGVQEYWIPITASGSELSIPNDKRYEVTIAINNANNYWVRGVVIDNAYYPGYVSNTSDFIVPLSKYFMREMLGLDCAGKIHIVNDDGYTVSIEPDKFIVTLTPTAADYSGTMDKTVAEIDAAYKAGREIVFRVYTAAGTYNEADCTVMYKNNNLAYPSFNAYIVDNINNVLIFAYTGANNDGTAQAYSTAVYPLTHEPFIVTLTPTDEDFSGTMDKTVAEINEAYLSGRRIVFSISAHGMNVEFPLVDANESDNYDYPSFDAVIWNVIDDIFMHVSTSFTDDGDKNTYSVYTFPMTYDSANGVSF